VINASREALLAAANNVDWYDAVFRSLVLPPRRGWSVGRSRDPAPPYHSNAVILSPVAGDAHRRIIRKLARDLGRPFSFKDGFATTISHRTVSGRSRCRMDLARRSPPLRQPETCTAEWRRVVDRRLSSPPGKWV